MRITLIAIISVCHLVAARIEKEMQSYFLSNSFCGIPFRKETLNDILKHQTFIKNDNFRESLKRINTDPAVLHSSIPIVMERNGRTLAAFMNIPNSPFCQSIASRPSSAFGKMRSLTVISKDSSLEIYSQKKISDFLQQFFNGKEITDELSSVFNEVQDLYNFSYPAIWNFCGSFNFLQINQARKQPASPASLVREFEVILSEYVAFYCSFLEKVPGANSKYFIEFMMTLNEGSIMVNELIRIHLSNTKGFIGDYLIEHYDSLVKEKDIPTFCKQYLAMFFNPKHLNELIELACKFNTSEKLKESFMLIETTLLQKELLDVFISEGSYWFKLMVFLQATLNACFDDVSSEVLLALVARNELFSEKDTVMDAKMTKNKKNSKQTLKSTSLHAKNNATLHENEKNSINSVSEKGNISVIQDINTLMQLFQIMFKVNEKIHRLDALTLYLNVCSKPAYLKEVCPPSCIKELPIETRVRLVIDFILEPFRGKSLQETENIIISRYKMVLQHIDCSVIDPKGIIFSPSEAIETKNILLQKLQKYVEELQNHKK